MATTTTGQVWLDGREHPDPRLGSMGVFTLLDLRLTGVISGMARHVIKRYLKCVGFSNLKAKHVQDSDPFTLRFIVEGRAGRPLKDEQLKKLDYLDECVVYVLGGGDSGVAPHPSKADADLLRRMLAKTEPRLRKVYHAKA